MTCFRSGLKCLDELTLLILFFFILAEKKKAYFSALFIYESVFNKPELNSLLLGKGSSCGKIFEREREREDSEKRNYKLPKFTFHHQLINKEIAFEYVTINLSGNLHTHTHKLT